MGVNLPLMIRRVHGHSMVPTLPPGTLVLAWRWSRKVRPQQVVILSREGREIIKRVDHIEPDGLYVLGDHPETSTDSRQFGLVKQDLVEGSVFWPRTAPG